MTLPGCYRHSEFWTSGVMPNYEQAWGRGAARQRRDSDWTMARTMTFRRETDLFFLKNSLSLPLSSRRERDIYICVVIYIYTYIVCVFVGARTLRSLVVLAPCACVDFIILFQLADLGPGLGRPSHFYFLLIVWCEMPQDAPYRVGWGLGGIIAFFSRFI